MQSLKMQVEQMWDRLEAQLYPCLTLIGREFEVYRELVQLKAFLDALRSTPEKYVDRIDRAAALVMAREHLAKIDNGRVNGVFPQCDSANLEGQALLSSLLNACYHHIRVLQANEVSQPPSGLPLNESLVDLLASLKAGYSYQAEHVSSHIEELQKIDKCRFGDNLLFGQDSLENEKILEDHQIRLARQIMYECMLDINCDKDHEIKRLSVDLKNAQEQLTERAMMNDGDYPDITLQLYKRVLNPAFSALGYVETKAKYVVSSTSSRLYSLVRAPFDFVSLLLRGRESNQDHIEKLRNEVESSKKVLKSRKSFPSLNKNEDLAIVGKIGSDLEQFVNHHQKDIEISPSLRTSIEQCRALISSF